MLEFCSREFPVRAVDLNPENIGKEKYGVLVEDAGLKTQELIEWCDLLLVTGSTLANGTIDHFLGLDKKVIFYGTTIAGAAKVLGLDVSAVVPNKNSNAIQNAILCANIS